MFTTGEVGPDDSSGVMAEVASFDSFVCFLEDPEARGFTVISAAGFVSGAAAAVCFALFGAFSEALFDCMELIVGQTWPLISSALQPDAGAHASFDANRL